MNELLHVIEVYGLAVIFLSVLIDQGGMPLPAYPALIVTAANAAERSAPVWPILAVAVAASLIADAVWFRGGRRHGDRLLGWMSKISLSDGPRSLATNGPFARWGLASLLVAKFVPGFAAIVTILAGQARTRLRTFLLFDALGALLWVGVAIGIGVVFHREVGDALAGLLVFGQAAGVLALVALAAVVGRTVWQRRRVLDRLRRERVAAKDLLARLESGERVVVLDVRTTARRDAGGWIPGSIHVPTLDDATAHASDEVVVYCDCPHETSAAVLAVELRVRGFGRVRLLEGGFARWKADDFPVVGGADAVELRRGHRGPRPRLEAIAAA